MRYCVIKIDILIFEFGHMVFLVSLFNKLIHSEAGVFNLFLIKKNSLRVFIQ